VNTHAPSKVTIILRMGTRPVLAKLLNWWSGSENLGSSEGPCISWQRRPKANPMGKDSEIEWMEWGQWGELIQALDSTHYMGLIKGPGSTTCRSSR
jgi:hypothetical protein